MRSSLGSFTTEETGGSDDISELCASNGIFGLAIEIRDLAADRAAVLLIVRRWCGTISSSSDIDTSDSGTSSSGSTSEADASASTSGCAIVLLGAFDSMITLSPSLSPSSFAIASPSRSENAAKSSFICCSNSVLSAS